MRTNNEHIFSKVRRLRQRFTRLARRVAAWCVRAVLKRAQGERTGARQLAEVDDVASAATDHVNPEKASKSGLPREMHSAHARKITRELPAAKVRRVVYVQNQNTGQSPIWRDVPVDAAGYLPVAASKRCDQRAYICLL